MVSRKLATRLSGIALGCWLGGIAGVTGAEAMTPTTRLLTFNDPIGLPGVTLAAGTYIFELVDTGSAWPIVRVWSADRRLVHYADFTQPVERPADMRQERAVSFGEAPFSRSHFITVWWPPNERRGYQFIYRPNTGARRGDTLGSNAMKGA